MPFAKDNTAQVSDKAFLTSRNIINRQCHFERGAAEVPQKETSDNVNTKFIPQSDQHQDQQNPYTTN